jgi:hypothetical protein
MLLYIYGQRKSTIQIATKIMEDEEFFFLLFSTGKRNKKKQVIAYENIIYNIKGM